jgi:WW domain-containing oxidoreductase
MAGRSLSAGTADQCTYALKATAGEAISSSEVSDTAQIHLQAIFPKDSHMAQSIPFGPRSTADQVLAGIDLSRKRVLITGCNSVIGLETMKAVSANGAVVIGVAPTLSEAEIACSEVARSIPLGCDPTDIASVDAAMESLQRLSGPLDAVIINSFELRCFADHIAQFVLVNRLAEFVRHGTGRIVIAANDRSEAELPVENVVFDDLSNERMHDPRAFHEQTQLAAALFVQELSRRLEARGVLVNAFQSETPGNQNPHEARPAPAPQRVIQTFLRYFSRSPAQRAATPALLAASPLVAGIAGEHWLDCQISRRSPPFRDAGLARRLWDISAQIAAMMLGHVNPARAGGLGGETLFPNVDIQA